MEKQFILLSLVADTVNTTGHFFFRWEVVFHSAHLFSPFLSSLSPPFSVLISDFTVIYSILSVTLHLKIPNFVLYVNFRSRTAMGVDHIRELASSLVMSQSKFLWVLKTTIVDKEDEASIDKVLGSELVDKIKNSDRGIVFKGWVD